MIAKIVQKPCRPLPHTKAAFFWLFSGVGVCETVNVINDCDPWDSEGREAIAYLGNSQKASYTKGYLDK